MGRNLFANDNQQQATSKSGRNLFANSNQNEPQQQQGLLQRAGDFAQRNINEPIERNIVNPTISRAGGFGQGLANIAPGLANLGISGINALGGNLPKVPMIDLAHHNPEAQQGELLSFFAGPGGVLRSFGRIPELYSAAHSAMKIPMIAEGIKHASNLLGKSPAASRVAGNALLGGAYAPDNPLIGMGLGAGAGALGEVASKGYSGVKNYLGNNEFIQNNLSKVSPWNHAKDIEHTLSGGTNNITKNAEELAKDIRQAHNMRNEEAKIFYDFALNKAGNKKIYEANPMILNKVDESESTLNKIKDLNVGDLYHQFKLSPTFMNAHKLQSGIGTMERTVKQMPRTQDTIHQLGKINSAKSQLKDDISKFLNKYDQTTNQPIGHHYNKATELFEKNVVPFLEDKKILDITRGGKTNVKDIHIPFNTPSNKITKEGTEKIGAINKIMSDLPESSKNRILFSAIGGNKLSPEALLEKLMQIKSKGYGSYFGPELDKSINALGNKINNRDTLKSVGKLAGIGGTAALGANALSHLF
jgi:hypothetical protein